jgi:hypothetical protein
MGNRIRLKPLSKRLSVGEKRRRLARIARRKLKNG